MKHVEKNQANGKGLLGMNYTELSAYRSCLDRGNSAWPGFRDI